MLILLKILDDGVILESQAQLAASLKAVWDEGALAAAERLVTHLTAATGATEQSDSVRVKLRDAVAQKNKKRQRK